MVSSGVQQNGTKMIWSLIVMTVVTDVDIAAVDNSLSRSAYCITQENKRLAGNVVERFDSTNLMSCSQSCLRKSWCSSTNFKLASKEGDKGTCELIKHEINSIKAGPKLIDLPGVVSSMFLKGCRVTGCLNGGSCLFDEGNGTFTCTCQRPWSGDRCEVKIAPNCGAIYMAGEHSDGIYTIKPDDLDPFDVYCDQTTNGGGWTVFQKRLDGSVEFYLNWIHYKRGFGNLNGEFWLGLDKIHRLTSDNNTVLRVDLEDGAGDTAYAMYTSFRVMSEQDKYRLITAYYNGTAGDSLTHQSNGQQFSTKDQDNDNSNLNCAQEFHGAWWYRDCHESNLNGRYKVGRVPRGDGVIWYTWKKHEYGLKRAEMKIRPFNFKRF